MAWRAERTVPLNGAHQSSWRSGAREIAGKPDRDAGGRLEPAVQCRSARCAQRRALTPTADTGCREGHVERLRGRPPKEIDHAPEDDEPGLPATHLRRGQDSRTRSPGCVPDASIVPTGSSSTP